MGSKIWLSGMLVLSLLLTLFPAQASDLEKEKRWEAQIVDALIVGEAVKLKAGDTEFLALFAEHNTEKAMGAAIVLHGIGAHPAWPEVVEPLRTNLPDHGWATLSLQMPILPNEAETEQYAPLFKNEVRPRIQAGVDFLKQKGIQNIVIVAHSLGASMASHYLSQKRDPAISAFVGIGMSRNMADPSMDTAASLRNINKLPVLDLYGSRDLSQVLDSAKARADAATRAGNKQFSQVKIEGADHFFSNMDAVLVKRVRGWMAKHAAGTELPKK